MQMESGRLLAGVVGRREPGDRRFCSRRVSGQGIGGSVSRGLGPGRRIGRQPRGGPEGPTDDVRSHSPERSCALPKCMNLVETGGCVRGPGMSPGPPGPACARRTSVRTPPRQAPQGVRQQGFAKLAKHDPLPVEQSSGAVVALCSGLPPADAGLIPSFHAGNGHYSENMPCRAFSREEGGQSVLLPVLVLTTLKSPCGTGRPRWPLAMTRRK